MGNVGWDQERVFHFKGQHWLHWAGLLGRAVLRRILRNIGSAGESHSQLMEEAQEGREGTCTPVASVARCSLMSMSLIMAETSRTAVANMFSCRWPQRLDSWSQSITSESLSLAVLTSKIPSCLPCWCLEILSRFFIFFLVCVCVCVCVCVRVRTC